MSTEDLTKCGDVVEQLISYYEEHISYTVMEQLHEEGVIDETDDKGMELIEYTIKELLYKLNAND